MGRLVVVSNRLVTSDLAGSAGGLAVALKGALREQPGFWFGWSGERTAQFTGWPNRACVDGVDILTLDLEQADYDEYYAGYANGTLWPLFHSRTDLAAYDRSYSEGYARVNRRFAEALSPLLEPDDLVWIHDYHLMLLGRELRRLGVKNRLGFFLHIPWPAAPLYVTLPHHADLAAALFEFDLIGLQTPDSVARFESYVLSEAGGERRAGRLVAFGRATTVGAFPIGLDTEDFLSLASSEAAAKAFDRVAAHGLFRALIVGVDRLDYSKGIEERLGAFERLLTRRPDLVRKLLYLQIAPTSREDVGAYQELRARVMAEAGRINAIWSEVDHAPIHYVNRNYGRAELAGIYRAARIGLVTPLRDGMNLVAKEFVAAQDPADPGVLVLSRFAGAAAQMDEALIVNPYDREEVADALEAALVMDRSERQRRWRALMEGVVRDDVTAWRKAFVDRLEHVHRGEPVSERPKAAPKAPAPLSIARSTAARTARRLLTRSRRTPGPDRPPPRSH
jgi:trehalose 6-phosphate synthase